MCIICIEFQRSKDIADARRMINAARNEPNSVDEEHLIELEERLKQAEKAKNP